MSASALGCEIAVLISAVFLKLVFWEQDRNYQNAYHEREMLEEMVAECD
jgi:hypothetical protein